MTLPNQTKTLSAEASENQREYTRRKNRARVYLWTEMKTKHRGLFDDIVAQFNETQGGKFTKDGIL